VIRVANGIKATSSQTRIWGVEKFSTCPGKKTDPEARARGEIKFLDADPVTFRMGLLMIDNIALASVSAEIVSQIYRRLLVSLSNGRIGYISDDASYDNPTYQVAGSPLKRGCGESTIVDGFLEMMRNSKD
jgi:neutral ceramidase